MRRSSGPRWDMSSSSSSSRCSDSELEEMKGLAIGLGPLLGELRAALWDEKEISSG